MNNCDEDVVSEFFFFTQRILTRNVFKANQKGAFAALFLMGASLDPICCSLSLQNTLLFEFVKGLRKSLGGLARNTEDFSGDKGRESLIPLPWRDGPADPAVAPRSG